MAVPVINNITPSAIKPFTKQLLKLDGTGFNYWSTLPVPNAGMSATIDGVATTIQVCDDTLAFATAREYVNKKKIPYDAQTVDFTIGQVLKGATSQAEGVIVADHDLGTTGTLTLEDVSGTFVDDEAIIDPLGGSATANAPEGDDVLVLRIANLDAAGVEIAGENVETTITVSRDAIVYPDAQPHLQQVFFAFIDRLISNYKIPVTTAADVDWTESGQLIRTIAEPPGIALTDFDLERIRPSEPEYHIYASRIYRDTLCFQLNGAFLIGCNTTEEAMRYIVTLFQFQRRTPLFTVDGVRVKFEVDDRAEIAFNVGEGIKSWTLGFSLSPIVVECPEEIELAFTALAYTIEASRKALT